MGTYIRHIRRAEIDRYWECTSQTRMDTHKTMLEFTKWRQERKKAEDNPKQ